MREFQVYYSGLYIGRLLVNERGQHLYSLNDSFRTNCFLKGKKVANVLKSEQRVFGDPIPYFKARIELIDRLKGRPISFVSDDVRLKEVF